MSHEGVEETQSTPLSEEELLAQIIAYDDIELLEPDKLKLESDLGLETVWMWGMAISFLVGVVTLLSHCENNKHPLDIVWWSFGAFGIFTLFKILTDNYHILDLDARKLLYHQKFLGLGNISTRCTFSELVGAVVKGSNTKSRHGDMIWSYELILVTREGKKYRVSDETQVKREVLNELVQKLGDLLDCPSYTIDEEECTHITYNAEALEVQIEQRPAPPVQTTKPVMIALYIVLTVIVIAGLVAYFTSKA